MSFFVCLIVCLPVVAVVVVGVVVVVGGVVVVFVVCRLLIDFFWVFGCLLCDG